MNNTGVFNNNGSVINGASPFFQTDVVENSKVVFNNAGTFNNLAGLALDKTGGTVTNHGVFNNLVNGTLNNGGNLLPPPGQLLTLNLQQLPVLTNAVGGTFNNQGVLNNLALGQLRNGDATDPTEPVV